jgi:hypothetical protein
LDKKGKIEERETILNGIRETASRRREKYNLHHENRM